MATLRWSVIAELASSQHGVFSRPQAASNQISPARIRTMVAHGLLDEPVRGVLRDTLAPRTWEQQVMIGTLVTGGFASGPTAAGLHGLEGFERSGPVEVTVARGRHRPVPGAVVRSATCVDRRDITVVDAIPTASVALTLCDLGRTASFDDVERTLDHALRRGVSARWITDTLRRVDRPGPSGSAVLRRVMAQPDRQGTVPDSFRERVTERMLSHPDLQPLVRQYEILDGDGHVIARSDLAVVRVRLGIEFHSDQWHYGPRRGRGDRRRDLRAAMAGWELLYLDAADHRSPEAAVASVLAVAKTRGGSQICQIGQIGQIGQGQPGQTMDWSSE